MGPGIQLEGSGSQNNLVQNDFSRREFSGAKALVADLGVRRQLRHRNRRGDDDRRTNRGRTQPDLGDLESGVALIGSQSTGNVIDGDFIGANVTGTRQSRTSSRSLDRPAVGDLIGGSTGVTSGNPTWAVKANLISSGGAEGILLEPSRSRAAPTRQPITQSKAT